MIDGASKPSLDRLRFSLRVSGARLADADPLRSGVHSRGYLPHLKREGAWYFVTFRLADSLPNEVLLRYQQERTEHLCQLVASRSPDRKQLRIRLDAEIRRDYQRKIERYLDTGAGACSLGRPEIAKIVAGALRFFEGDRYLLREWVVMPNHVHVVVCPLPNHVLSAILQSWKRFTAREANRLLHRAREPFWQPESFDHWIRDDGEMARVCRYVIHNPVIANLCKAAEDWPWSSAGARARTPGLAP